MKKNAYEVVAYYFPNWHRQKDKGDDIGEWPVLKNAPKRFPGHAQPKVPVWGYEDESDPAVMAKKIDAAADHGVSTFLFDWYFNDNGPFLEKALNEGYLKAKNIERVKFALMWANHDLLSAPGAIGRATFEKLVAHAMKYWTHPNHWKIDGKPFFSIYQITTLIKGFGSVDETRAALESLQKAAKASGLPGIHVNIVDWELHYHPETRTVARQIGADSVTPYVWTHLIPMKEFPENDYNTIGDKYFDYCQTAPERYGLPYYPNVTMGWDSTPRIAPGAPHANAGYPDTPVLTGNSPENFKRALKKAKAFLDQQPPERRILTINAWNEWTEGSYLEPDTVHKLGYLEAIRDTFQ